MDYSKMTDDEFFAEIERRYGKEWLPNDIENDKEIYEEYLRRISTGIQAD